MPIDEGKQQDKKRYSEMHSFINKLKRLPRFTVKLGRLEKKKGKFTQKMVDVLLSLDIFERSLSHEHIILIAGDSDFVPVIRKAKRNQTLIYLIYHSESTHNELLDEADEIHEITENLINSCKLES